MTELCLLSKSPDRIQTQIIFVHGLSGDIKKTWTCGHPGSEVLWPCWLQEDIPGIAVWLLGYQAAKTNWRGYSFPLSGRADSILALLLIEPGLRVGNIVFIAHSLGGLIIKQVLRNAHRDAGSDSRAKNFLARTRKIAFLGTPHKGSFFAAVAARFPLLARPSDATRDLLPRTPQLTDLNNWYRRYSDSSGMQHLLLKEGKPASVRGITLPKIFGFTVSQESADGGLRELPIPVDEDHIGICKPRSKNAEVYKHVRDFISRSLDSEFILTRQMGVENRNFDELQTNARSAGWTHEIENSAALQTAPSNLVDAELDRRLERLRKCRVFPEFHAMEEARALAMSLEEGDLASASEEQKSIAFAWCARILSVDAPDEATGLLARVSVSSEESHSVAQGLVKAARGDLNGAIEDLCELGTPVAYGAAYTCALRMNGVLEANSWLQRAGLAFTDLDSNGKLNYVRTSLEAGMWDVAFEAAKEVTHEDFELSPALCFATADAYLMQAVPEESRSYLLQQPVPFGAAKFPLRGDPKALKHRRRAADLYERLHSFAVSSELPGVAGLMDDKVLWLRLVDPASSAEAHEVLEQSLRAQDTFLRRLGFGLQFGIEIDLERAEREVGRQTALSGGNSQDAALARFALALSQGNPAAVTAYIDAHRPQLMRHLAWKGVCFVEMEMLAKAGHLAKAEERLKEAIKKGLSEPETAQLRQLLSETSGGDPITARLAAYQVEGSIGNLSMLVAAYEEARDWSNVCEYGRKLVETTGDLGDARRHAIALYNFGRQEEALQVMEEFPGLLAEDGQLQLLRAQLQFDCGRLEEARQSLRTLRKSGDSFEARQLQISLAAVSGDWDSLQGFVEEEWNARCDRTALELLRAGQIAEIIGAARGEELVREAASRAGDDPETLAGCFHVASAAGWEDNVEVYRWIERAAEFSDGDGPVQAVQLQNLIDWKPDWEQRESKAWDLLEKGEIPAFAAGKLLNRTLLSLNLMPALFNLNEPDVRKRILVPAFSGAREKAKASPENVAMDATALISAEFLELLDVCFEEFDAIIIPHYALGWLLEERARIKFRQPSRVAAARELRDMIAVGHLQAFEGSNVAPERLVNEVGAPLAALLAEAASEHQDSRNRLVVRGGPVHKVSSLMEEEADLKGYEAHLCSCVSVVEMLKERGLLTDPEARKARAALNFCEKPWPTEPRIADGAVLYLDDLAVSRLQRLGLLSKLHQAGIRAQVSGAEIEEADALISYDERAGEVVEIVERLRRRLRDGIESGRVRLGKAYRGKEGDGHDQMMSHPTVDILRLVADADVMVVDDRYMNRHGRLKNEKVDRPMLTTVDLLDVLSERGSISEERRQEALTRLRQANFALVPLTAEELLTLVAQSTVKDEALEETAELRAIRESAERVRMSKMLQSPQELVWLNGVAAALLVCIKQQWKDGLDEAKAAARSDWLFALGDVRAWTHRVDENVEELKERFRKWVLTLMTLPSGQRQSVKEAYWRWLDSRVLEPLQEEDPETYHYLVERAKENLAECVETCAQGL